MKAQHLIREARLRAGLSQTQLAELLNTSQAAVARWEAGGVEPRYDHLCSAIRACGFDFRVDIQPIDPSLEALLARQLSLTPKARVEGLRNTIKLRSGLDRRRLRKKAA